MGFVLRFGRCGFFGGGGAFKDAAAAAAGEG